MNADEIRTRTFPRSFRGYDPVAVQRLLDEAAAALQGLAREKAELEAGIAKLEAELAEHREIQGLMKDALVSAQRAAEELKARTRAECEALLAQARADAQAIEDESRATLERSRSEVRRLKAAELEIRASYKILLHAALDRLEEPMTEQDPKPSLLDALAPQRVTERAEERSGEHSKPGNE